MTCVLVHGFTGSPAAWDDAIAHARLGPRPVAIALPGHGGGSGSSGGGDVARGWDANLDVVAAAIAARGMAGAPVVGYSLGARVALGLIVTGRAPCGVLIGVHPGLAADDAAERAARRAHDAGWIERLAAGGLDAFAAAWEAQPVLAAPHATPEALARRAAVRRAHDPRGLAASLAHMGLAEMPDYRAALAAHADRVHLVAGADDAKFLALARALVVTGEPRLTVIDGSGHDPTLEQPAALMTVIEGALAALRR